MAKRAKKNHESCSYRVKEHGWPWPCHDTDPCGQPAYQVEQVMQGHGGDAPKVSTRSQPTPAPRPTPSPKLPPSPLSLHLVRGHLSLSSMAGPLTSQCPPAPHKYMDFTEGSKYDDHHQAFASKSCHNPERHNLVSKVGLSHVLGINNSILCRPSRSRKLWASRTTPPSRLCCWRASTTANPNPCRP